MTHTIRKWRIGDVPLCPSLLWKEVDVELGRVFRGKDFNLERRGLVRDPTQMGRWKPVRNKGLPARRHEHDQLLSSVRIDTPATAGPPACPRPLPLPRA